MTHLFVALLLLQGTPIAGSTDPGPVQSEKNAWEWSIEDRIAARVGTASVNSRVEAHGPAARYVIEGRRNPELFLPVELLDPLVRNGILHEEDEVRRRYRAEIAKFGIEGFWDAVEEEAAEYLERRRSEIALGKRLNEASEDERSEILAAIKAVQAPQCRNRAAAIAKLSERLGRPFDRVLYEFVVKDMFISDRRSLEQQRLSLIRKSGECGLDQGRQR